MHAQVNPLVESRRDAANDEVTRESTRPIRALNRGLEVLTELNRLERAAININDARIIGDTLIDGGQFSGFYQISQHRGFVVFASALCER